MSDFELLIKNNYSIIKTLFRLNDGAVTIVDNKTRVFTKVFQTEKLFHYIPILKGFLEELYKDFKTIPLIIKETFDKDKLQFIYKIKFLHKDLNNFKGIIKLSVDYNEINNDINYDTKKINAHLNLKKKKNTNNLIIDEIAPSIIINYYKMTFLENELKPLISNLSHRSFALNII